VTGELPGMLECCDGGPHLRKSPWSINQYYDIQDRLGTEPLENIARDYGTERLNLYWELIHPAGDKWRVYQFSAQKLAKEINKIHDMRVTNAAVRNWFTTGRIRGYYEQDLHMRAKRAGYTNAPQPKTDRRAVGRVIIDVADYMWLLSNYSRWMMNFPRNPGVILEAETEIEIDLHDKAVGSGDYKVGEHERALIIERKTIGGWWTTDRIAKDSGISTDLVFRIWREYRRDGRAA
jgi:hypothetical protein